MKPNTSYLITSNLGNTVVHVTSESTWFHATIPTTKATVDWNIDPTSIAISKLTYVSYPITMWAHSKTFVEISSILNSNPELFI